MLSKSCAGGGDDKLMIEKLKRMEASTDIGDEEMKAGKIGQTTVIAAAGQ